jgi:hypothetical protein
VDWFGLNLIKLASCLLWRHQWSVERKDESFGVYEWRGMIALRNGFWILGGKVVEGGRTKWLLRLHKPLLKLCVLYGFFSCATVCVLKGVDKNGMCVDFLGGGEKEWIHGRAYAVF